MPSATRSPVSRLPAYAALVATAALWGSNPSVSRMILDAVPPVHSVVLEASAVHRVTVPMLDGLRSLQQELATEGFTLRLAGVPPETLEVLRRDAWFADAEAAGLVFATVDEAVAAGH